MHPPQFRCMYCLCSFKLTGRLAAQDARTVVAEAEQLRKAALLCTSAFIFHPCCSPHLTWRLAAQDARAAVAEAEQLRQEVLLCFETDETKLKHPGAALHRTLPISCMPSMYPGVTRNKGLQWARNAMLLDAMAFRCMAPRACTCTL